ncbi:MAG: rhodanese-related sulfurtransferase [Nanoarchaeota archaeon]
MIKILLYYKYVNINDIESFKNKHLADCESLGLKGRILLSAEGINGSVSGTAQQTESYKKLLTSDSRFSDIKFKEDDGVSHPFKRMIIKVKKEIVRFEHDVNLKNTGKHISPKQFLEVYELDDNDKPLIIDARNNYEARVGRFKDAVILPIKTFSEFPKAINDLNIPKNKPVVMYCTGGVRCEKASAFMKEQGYNDVSQLSGGILTFGKEFPDTVWEGKCFVFDKRLLSPINKKDVNNIPLTSCESCSIPCDLYKNCRNVTCDKYTIMCISCDDKLAGNCSEKCKKEYLASREERMEDEIEIKN